MESLRHNRILQAALVAITAAVAGVILNLSAWFALRTLFGQVRTWRAGSLQVELPVWTSLEPGALVLSAFALLAMLRFRLVLGWTLVGCAVLGTAYWWLRHGG